ncbi:MAG: hypothetical protein KC486_32255 [Myxococcales bacterium]|nr:hypothetical protein [Myxococcales bacterium]
MRRAVRRAVSKRGKPLGEGDELRPRSWVCATCGQLAWPEAVDPHRDDHARPPTVTAECSHCGDRAWIDLGDESTALVISSREHNPGRRLAFNVALYAAAGAFLMIVLATIAVNVVDLWVAWIGAAIGALGALRLNRGGAAPPALLPVRWSMSLPPAEATTEEVAGAIDAADEGIAAPLTGRRCLAYEVAVRDDERADAPPPTWALVEQRVGAFTIAGEAFEGAGVHLDLEREYLGQAAKIDLSPAAVAFLQQRGLEPGVDTLHLFESIVRVGDGVVLRRGPSGARLSPRKALAAAPADRPMV